MTSKVSMTLHQQVRRGSCIYLMSVSKFGTASAQELDFSLVRRLAGANALGVGLGCPRFFPLRLVASMLIKTRWLYCVICREIVYVMRATEASPVFPFNCLRFARPAEARPEARGQRPSDGNSVSRHVGLSVCRSVGPSVRWCVGLSVIRSVGLSVGLSVSRAVGILVCRSQMASQSVGQSVCRSGLLACRSIGL